MKKIAVTGVSNRERKILSHALSCLTGYDLVRQTAYACQAVKLNLNHCIEKCDWYELFTYALSAFTERIEIEQQFDAYISNGSVFHELAYLEALYTVNRLDRRKSDEYASMYSTLKKVISEYALREYDYIIHINVPVKKMDQLLFDVNQSLVGMVQGCRKSFVIDNNSLLPDMLGEILSELQIEPLLPVHAALKRVNMEI